MRLEPVYLVAPKPKPPSMPHRRAFLIAGGTFLAGIGLGGACGYAVGASHSEAPGGDEEPDLQELLQPSGDSDLDELRRLAVKAPIEELMAKRMDFLQHLYLTYPRDKVAWSGVARIAQATIDGYEIDNRRMFAVWLAQVIEKSHLDVQPPLLPLSPQLRRLK